MKKKTTIFMVSALCAVSMAIGASADSIIKTVESQLRPDFTVMIDGEKKTFKNVNGETVYPMLYEGTTYLPIRAIGEIMGKTVYWYEEDKRIELKTESTTVTDADVIVTGDANKNDNKKEENNKNNENKKNDNSSAEVNRADIGVEAAKKAALDKAGFAESEVRMKEVERDEDDGRIIYEIEFEKDGVEYKADVLASDGSIVSWERDDD